jgi:hypothetical protein
MGIGEIFTEALGGVRCVATVFSVTFDGELSEEQLPSGDDRGRF